jgi:hypothetical protein
MKLKFYPFDMASCTMEFDGAPQSQADICERFKRLSMYLKHQDKGIVAVAGSAIQQLADLHGCTVHYVKHPDTDDYLEVWIESKQE